VTVKIAQNQQPALSDQGGDSPNSGISCTIHPRQEEWMRDCDKDSTGYYRGWKEAVLGNTKPETHNKLLMQ